MSETYIDPSKGSVVLPTGHGADFASIDITESQQSESVASYGTGLYDPHRGTGTPHQSISVGGFAKKGASSPGFGAVPSSSPPVAGLSAAGGSATFTLDTGVTFTGNYIVTSIRLIHARLRAAVPLTFQLENSGDISVTWPTT